MEHTNNLVNHFADTTQDQAANLIPTPQKNDFEWVLISGFIIIITQIGFALLETGSIRYKNSQSIVIKVILGLFLTILIWWLFGYGFAFGWDFGYNFLGGSKLGGAGWNVDQYGDDYTNFVFRSIGASVGISIIAGAVAERMRFISWSILVVFYAGFIYPALVHWTFAQGWLNKLGYSDFSGSGVVFYAAGIAALIATKLLRPRDYRLNQNQVTKNYKSHSPVYIGFGALFIFAGWLAFNAGVIVQGKNDAQSLGLVTTNTLIAGATAGYISFFAKYLLTNQLSLTSIARGSISGLVAISAVVNVVPNWAAFLIGLFAGLIYLMISKVIFKSSIDDPIDSVAIFLVPGLFGTIVSGIIPLVTGKGAVVLGVQLLTLLIITLWVGFFIALLLIILQGSGYLRITEEQESFGIDKSESYGEALEFADTYQVQEIVKFA